MQSTYHLALVLFSLLVLVTGVKAKEVVPAASIEHVDISVYALAYAEGHQSVYLTNSKNEASEIRLSTANLLGPVQTALDADSTITLRTKKETEEGAPIYPPIAQVKLPVEIKEPLLVLIPSTGNQPYEALIIDRSLESFPAGSYLLINLSSMDIRGVVGNTKVAVAADSVSSVIPSSDQEDLLDVHFEYERPNRWKTFARTRWAKEGNKRSLLLAYLDPKTKRMKIRGVTVKPLASTNE
jgi:hypothetical protein